MGASDEKLEVQAVGNGAIAGRIALAAVALNGDLEKGRVIQCPAVGVAVSSSGYVAESPGLVPP